MDTRTLDEQLADDITRLKKKVKTYGELYKQKAERKKREAETAEDRGLLDTEHIQLMHEHADALDLVSTQFFNLMKGITCPT